jgi:putative polyhydroxyalkanoate system protein
MIIVGRHHDLGVARAKRLAETIARQLQDDYGGSYTWKGNELHFQRTGASGCVTVTKDGFQVRVELGFLLTPLRSRIEREIRAFCDEHLGEDEQPDRTSAFAASGAARAGRGSAPARRPSARAQPRRANSRRS